MQLLEIKLQMELLISYSLESFNKIFKFRKQIIKFLSDKNQPQLTTKFFL